MSWDEFVFAAPGADKAHPQCRLGNQNPGPHTYAQRKIFNSVTRPSRHLKTFVVISMRGLIKTIVYGARMPSLYERHLKSIAKTHAAFSTSRKTPVESGRPKIQESYIISINVQISILIER